MFFNRSRPPVTEVAPTEAHDRLTAGEGILVDVREPHEWRAGHAAGARHIPLGELPGRIAELPADETVFLICAAGGRSRTAAEMLSDAGVGTPINVRGGTAAWQGASLPMERGD